MKIPNFLRKYLRYKEFLFIALVILLTIFLFRKWFYPFPLSNGDWTYKFPQAIQEFQVYPFAWSLNSNNGFGGDITFLLGLDTYFSSTTATLFNIGIQWNWIEKLVWFWPFLIFSFLGSFLFFTRFFIKSKTFAAISSLIFTANTYTFMITGGGQMGVGMGYALIPFVFYGFFKILDEKLNNAKKIRSSMIAGMIFSLQLLFDIRIAYVTMIFIACYYFFRLLQQGLYFFKTTFSRFVLIPAGITLLLHFFWIVPFIISGSNPLVEMGIQYSTPGIIEFLSFARLENSISLLHPNWPENLFGKVYFMRPEFLVIPILAFTPLLFIKNEKAKTSIVFFSFTALLSAFLAKGTNDPFGIFYTLGFNTIPGFQMFRDPTKWYGITIFSFSLLIPFALYKITQLKNVSMFKNFILIGFILFWGITIRHAVFGELHGTFSYADSPRQYFKLTEFLSSQDNFFRTLWIPLAHQYTYYSPLHPAVSGGDYLREYSDVQFSDALEKNLINVQSAGVKYVIIPDDTFGKIFIDDRKYSEKVRQGYVNSLKKIRGLTKTHEFGKIIVYETKSPNDLFWSPQDSIQITSWKMKSSIEYEVDVENVRRGDILVFSTNYNKNWVAIFEDGANLASRKYTVGDINAFNSFIFQNDGSYRLKIYFKPQKYVNIGIAVSLVGVAVLFFYIHKLK